MRVLSDDLGGPKHQQLVIVTKRVLAADNRVKADVEASIAQAVEIRLAIRFGDGRGLTDRVPGILSGVALHLKGEWIPATEAHRVGGEPVAVVHYTHDPVGFICTPLECFT